MQAEQRKPLPRRARPASVAKAVTSSTLEGGGKLNPAGMTGGSGILDLESTAKPKVVESRPVKLGLAVSKEAAAEILEGRAKAIAKSTSLELAGETMVLLDKLGRAVGAVELGGRVDEHKSAWVVKSAAAFERPTPTNIPAGSTGIVEGVRLLERRKAKSVHDPVTPKTAKGYQASRVVDKTLLADIRRSLVWVRDAADDAAAEVAKGVLAKALAEASKRKLRIDAAGYPADVRPILRRVAREVGVLRRVVKRLELAPDTDPTKLTTSELLEAHALLHRLLHLEAVRPDLLKGWTVEEAVGLHVLVVAELGDRGVAHPSPPLDELDHLSGDYDHDQADVEKAAGGENALAELVEAFGDGDRFPVLVQKRVDGLRVSICKTGDRVKISGEDGTDYTAKLPTAAAEVQKLSAGDLELEADLECWDGAIRKSAVALDDLDDQAVLQVSDLFHLEKDIWNWPAAERLEKLGELGIAQSTSSRPSLRTRLNELPAIQANDLEELEKAVRIVKALPGAAGVVIKPEAAVDPGEWLELESDVVVKGEASADPYLEYPAGEVPFVARTRWQGTDAKTELVVGLRKGRLALGWDLESQSSPSNSAVDTEAKAETIVAKSAELSLIDLDTGEWAAAELVAKRRAPLPWATLNRAGATAPPEPGRVTPPGATHLYPGVYKAIDRGVVEFGAQKPWSHEYFVRGAKGGYRLVLRKRTVGELRKARHSYSHCMLCNEAAPQVDVLWADGRGRAWFCKKCYPKWLRKNGGRSELEVVGTKAIVGGRAPAKYSDRHNRVETTKSADPPPAGGWVAVRAADPRPEVLTDAAVLKGWVPPLGVSALPQILEQAIPDELAYWRAATITKSRMIRDKLVETLDANKLELDFVGSLVAKAVEPAVPADAEAVQFSDLEKRTEEVLQVERFVSIDKIDTDRRLVTGIVLEPDEVDAQNDTIKSQVIERASIAFLSRYNSETQLGLMHKAFGDIGLELAHSWVALDSHKLGGKRVKKGSWLMTVKVVDEKLWKLVKKGEFTGFSIGGVAKVKG